jgi:hypothetical protein
MALFMSVVSGLRGRKMKEANVAEERKGEMAWTDVLNRSCKDRKQIHLESTGEWLSG